MTSRRRPRFGSPVRALAGLLLLGLLLFPASRVLGQDVPVSRWDSLKPAELEVELQSAVTALAALGEGNRSAAATAVGVPAIPETEIADWSTALTERADSLRELLRTIDDRERLLSTSEILRLTDLAQRRLLALSTSEQSSVDLAPTDELLASLRSKLAEYREAQEAAERTVELRRSRAQAIREEQRGLPGRTQELLALLDEFNPARGDFLDVYRRGTLEIRRRLLRERTDYADLALRRSPDLILLRELELRLEARRVAVALARVEQVEALLGASLRKALEKARDDLKKALDEPATNGPVAVFRLRKRVEVLEIRMATVATEQTQKVQLEAKVRAETVNQQVKERLARLKERFADTGGVSASNPALLRANLSYAEESRTLLERTLLPDLRGELRKAVGLRADAQDLLVAAAEIPHQDPPALRKLLDAVSKDEAHVAREAFAAEQEALRQALQQQYDRLNTGVQVLLETDSILSARREMIDDLQALVIRHLYWVRSDDALGMSTVTGCYDELKSIAGAWAGREVAASADASWRRGKLAYSLTLGGFLLLVGGGIYLHRRLSRFHASLKYWGGPFLISLQRLLATIFFSLLAPAALLLATLPLNLLELPDFLQDPLETLLLGLAAIWFLRRMLLAVFRDDGVAVANMHAPLDVAVQLRRAVKRVAAGLLALTLPYFVIKAIPLQQTLVHLPRVLYTLMLVWFGLVLLSLLRRRGPLMRRVVGTEGARFTAWGFLSPLIALGFLTILVMDILGYRFGSHLLATNSIRTFLTVLLLFGVYNLVTGLLEQAVKTFRDRRRAEVGAREARVQAEQFSRQVVRFSGVAVIVVAVSLLFRFWGFGSGIRSFFEAMQITQVDSATDTWLTAWDVAKAILWIIGGHFLVAYLPALLEVFLFSRLGKLQSGTRFILVSVSRYVVLLVAYSAAILSLRIDFSSLGWAFAAVSLGIGFGMQEIVSNFVSGLILFIERPVRVGDVVTVGTTTGTVEKIQIRATHILNWDRQVIVIPNRKFISEEVVNWTHNDLLVRSLVEVGVAYGTDVPRVREILFEIVGGMPRVLKEPAPKVWFWAFGESALTIRVFVHTELEFKVPTINELNLAIDARFKAEGIEIAFPQRDLHVRTVQEPAVLQALGGRPLTTAPEPLVPVDREELADEG